MTRQLIITDGVLSLDLLSLDRPGVTTIRGGAGASQLSRAIDIVQGSYGNAVLQEYSDPPVVENYRINIRGNVDQDETAEQLQALIYLMNRASQHGSSRYKNQIPPVYIIQQGTTETNPRYAMIYAVESYAIPDYFSTPFEVTNFLEDTNITVLREAYWRGEIPGKFPDPTPIRTPQTPGRSADIVMVPNGREDNQPQYIFSYGAGGAGFSANLIDSTSFSLTPNPATVGDIFYIGADDIFHGFNINLTQYGSYISVDGKIYAARPEYYNGAWSDMEYGVIAADYPADANITIMDTSAGFQGVGVWPDRQYGISWPGPFDWAKVTINGVNAYWVRFYVFQVFDSPAEPQHSGQLVRKTTRPYIEIDKIPGDAPALVALKLYSHGTGSTTRAAGPQRITIGSKSGKYLDNFLSRLNFHSLPPDYSIQLYTDVTIGHSPTAPDGQAAIMTFSTAITERRAIEISIENTQSASAYVGRYRLRLRGLVIGAGETVTASIKITMLDSFLSSFTYESEPRAFLSNDIMPEVLDFGLVSLPSDDQYSANPGITNMTIIVYLESTANTVDCELHTIELIPVDEMVLTTSDPFLPLSIFSTPGFTIPYSVLSGPGSAINNYMKTLVLDGGIEAGMPQATMTIKQGDVERIIGTINEMDAVIGSGITLDETRKIEHVGSVDFNITDTTARHIDYTDPGAAKSQGAGFMARYDDLIMVDGDEFNAIQAVDNSNPDPFILKIDQLSSTKRMALVARDDLGADTVGAWVEIIGQIQDIKILWVAATDLTSNDGYAELWLNGELKTEITGLDNGALVVDKVEYGAMALDVGTTGHFYLDSVWRSPGDGYPASRFSGFEALDVKELRWLFNGSDLVLQPKERHRIYFFMDRWLPETPGDGPLLFEHGFNLGVQAFIVPRWQGLRGGE